MGDQAQAVGAAQHLISERHDAPAGEQGVHAGKAGSDLLGGPVTAVLVGGDDGQFLEFGPGLGVTSVPRSGWAR